MSLMDIKEAFQNKRIEKDSNSNNIDLLLNRIAALVRAEIASFIQTEQMNSNAYEIDNHKAGYGSTNQLPVKEGFNLDK